ncbi:MAG: hypothetical protein M1495_19955 [Bacteroidetes bacterium]|nr:hypothetical protein [Bacteroidota bacterium]
MIDEKEYLAYLKYDGKLVEEGFLDARKSAEALYGLDESIRYFLEKDFPELKSLEYEIPVRVQKGTWEALIPNNIDEFMMHALGLWIAGKYVGSALSQIAKNDFENVSFKQIFKSIFSAITWLIKIAVHLKSMRKKKLTNLKFENNNELVGIPDENGNLLFVPKHYLELYVNCPENLFEKITSVVEDERTMEIGLTGDDNPKVRVTKSDKAIFAKNEEPDEILFPELQHNEFVELEGYVTRANETSNSIGFLYKDHILTCYPIKGNIVDHKAEIFTNSKLRGYIDRRDKFGNIIEKRPKVNFVELELINDPNKDSENLFNKQ